MFDSLSCLFWIGLSEYKTASEGLESNRQSCGVPDLILPLLKFGILCQSTNLWLENDRLSLVFAFRLLYFLCEHKSALVFEPSQYVSQMRNLWEAVNRGLTWQISEANNSYYNRELQIE